MSRNSSNNSGIRIGDLESLVGSATMTFGSPVVRSNPEVFGIIAGTNMTGFRTSFEDEAKSSNFGDDSEFVSNRDAEMELSEVSEIKSTGRKAHKVSHL